MMHPIEEAILFLLEIEGRNGDDKVRTRAKELEAAVRSSRSLPAEEKILPILPPEDESQAPTPIAKVATGGDTM